ncbi:MAG: hypothetical protein NTV94_18850 [Planctomycetota bacterium]|nr:hypothetical protein [Planctomycetota bacterium]
MFLALASAASLAGAQPCGGQVGYWPLQGDATDASLAGNHGVLNGTPAFVPGVNGLGMALDGVDDYVRVRNHPSLNPARSISVSAWYRPVTFSGSGNDSIVDKGYVVHSYPYYQYHLGVAGNTYGFGGSFGFNIEASGAGTAPGFWVPGRWYHLLSTWDGSICTLYIDGVVINANPLSRTLPDYGTDVLFGKFNNLNFHLPGAIDEIRIFNRALSQDEATLLHENPDGSPLITPAAVSTCPDSTVQLTVTSLAGNDATYQWRKEGVDIENAQSATLTLAHVSAADQGGYDCVVTTACGTRISTPATVSLCPGEFNCDGGVDGGDIDAFFAAWESGDSLADINQDGGVDGADVEDFFARWEGGC